MRLSEHFYVSLCVNLQATSLQSTASRLHIHHQTIHRRITVLTPSTLFVWQHATHQQCPVSVASPRPLSIQFSVPLLVPYPYTQPIKNISLSLLGTSELVASQRPHSRISPSNGGTGADARKRQKGRLCMHSDKNFLPRHRLSVVIIPYKRTQVTHVLIV